jgi:carbon-monoxide dehydrogenase medium subunit
MKYVRPATLQDAVSVLQSSGDKVFLLAGGTDLLVRMKSDEFNADLIVDIKSIESIAGVTQTERHFRIGAATTCAEIGEHAGLRTAWPGVVEAANLIGSTQIQERGTIIGNLCNASPAADSVPALVAAGARAVVAGPNGIREVPVEAVVTAPGETSLEKVEIVEAIILDKRPPNSRDAYLRFIPRTEMDIAVVGAAVNLTLDEDGAVSSARVVLGAVAPTAIVVDEAAVALDGTKLDETALSALAAACSAACQPIDDKRGTVDFRKQVAGVLARRAACNAFARAGGQ